MHLVIRYLLAFLIVFFIVANTLLIPGQARPSASSLAEAEFIDSSPRVAQASPGVAAKTIPALEIVPLIHRHPHAGVYSVWDGQLKGRNLADYPFLKGVHLYATWADLQPTENEPYRWHLLDQKVKEKTGGKPDTLLYLQVNARWPNWVSKHVAFSTFTKRDQRIPQFWDPLYINLYRQFINDLAKYIAKTPYRNRIVLVRAQFNAYTPESVSPDGYFSYQNYTPTARGHRHAVSYNFSIGNNYARQITRAFIEAFHPLGILVVQKPFSTSGHDQNIAAEYVQMGAGLFATNNGPNPNRRQAIYQFSTSLQTRSFSEPGTLGHCAKQPPEDAYRFMYWSSLSALHQGVEFISFYGCDIINPRYKEFFEFIDKYAGWYRKPKKSPGAWIAFRDIQNAPEKGWMNYLEGNYEYLIRQIHSETSTGLFGYSGAGNLNKASWTDINELNPLSKPVTPLGPKSQKEGVWARQTKGQPIYLDVNDTFAEGLTGQITFKISYFDKGKGKFKLIFKDGAGNLQNYFVQKGNTLRWKKFSLVVASYQLANGLVKGADILLDPAGDGDDIFHMLEITRQVVPGSELTGPDSYGGGELPLTPAVSPSPTIAALLPTVTSTPTAPPSPTRRPSATASATLAPTFTPRPSLTSTPTASKVPPTPTPTRFPTATPTPTSRPTASQTATIWPAVTSSPTPSPSPSQTPWVSETETPTHTPFPTATPVSPFTATPLIPPTATPTDTPLPADTDTPTPTDTPLPEATDTPTPTDTPLPEATETATPTETPLPEATDTATPTDTPVPDATETATPTDVPLPTATKTPTPTDTPVPDATETATPTDTPLPTASKTPTPTDTLVPEASDTPTPTETAAPFP